MARRGGPLGQARASASPGGSACQCQSWGTGIPPSSWQWTGEPWATTLRAPKRGSSSASTMRPGATQRCPWGVASQVASPSGRGCLSRPSRRGRSAEWRCWTRRQLGRLRAWRRTTQRTRRRRHLLRLAPSWAPPGGYKVEFPDGEESRLRYTRACSPSDGAAQVRTEFRISNRGDLPDPTKHIQNRAKRVAQLFATKPQATLPFEDEARKVMMGNQVAQSIRAEQRADDDTTLATLEANAAGQQGSTPHSWPSWITREAEAPSTRSRVADHHHRDACWTSASPHGPSGELLQTKTASAGRARARATTNACAQPSLFACITQQKVSASLSPRRLKPQRRRCSRRSQLIAQSPRARRWMQAARDLAPPSSSLSLRPPKQAKRRMPSPWTTTHRAQKCSRCSSKMCQARGISTRRASAKQGL